MTALEEAIGIGLKLMNQTVKDIERTHAYLDARKAKKQAPPPAGFHTYNSGGSTKWKVVSQDNSRLFQSGFSTEAEARAWWAKNWELFDDELVSPAPQGSAHIMGRDAHKAIKYSMASDLRERLDRRLAANQNIRTREAQQRFLETGEFPREESWINRKLQALREALVDYQLPFKAWLDKFGHSYRAWRELKLSSGKLKALMGTLDRKHLSALREQVRAVAKKYGLSVQQAVEYLGQWATLRHVSEANAHLRSKLERAGDQEALDHFDATQRGEGEQGRAKMAGGLTDTEAEELMGIAERKIDQADLARFADSVVQAFADLKEQAIRSGYISPQQAEGLPDFRYYVALTGDPLDTMGADIFGSGLNDTKILARHGRQSVADNAYLALLERAGRTLTYEATSGFKEALDEIYREAEEDVKRELGEDAADTEVKRAVLERYGLSKRAKTSFDDLSDAVLWRDPEDGKEWLFRFDDPALLR
jgi:hypothetical protein